MSFSKEKRERIISYLLEKIYTDDSEVIKKVSENFEITPTSVRRYIDTLTDKKIIKLDKKTQCGYTLISKKICFHYINKDLDESEIYFRDIAPALDPSLTPEARKIWAYVFTEICNNAIEHSQCNELLIEILKNHLHTDIVIQDNGIGIFDHISNTMSKQQGRKIDIHSAIMELHKGKFTSDSSHHSGEGIFFSSKMVDCFIIQSGGYAFKESLGSNELIESRLLSYYHKFNHIGTRAIIRVSNQTKRETKEVFDMFCDEDFNFCKTKIPVREINPMAYPVSRSEARRMLLRMEQFSDITLDFNGVDEMGQGFAHEVFVVFQNEHPDIHIHADHANRMVQKMISHVKN